MLRRRKSRVPTCPYGAPEPLPRRRKQEHRDLDTAIEALERMVAGDQLQIQRLKKRKLVLKDRIMRLEDQLTPDIIA
jgi:hypothetical protein